MKRKFIFGGGALLVVLISVGAYVYFRTSDDFRCPEEYTDQEGYVRDLEEFILKRQKESPDSTLDALLKERKKLLEEHGCEGSTAQEVSLSEGDAELIAQARAATASLSQRTLEPDMKTVVIAGNEYGSFGKELDAEAGIASLYYEFGPSEWYYLNFYLPAYWPDEWFSALDLADYLRASLASTLYYAFTSPDPVTNSDAYYLVLIDEDTKKGTASAYLMKISQVGDTPYSAFYGRQFSGQSPRDDAVRWLAEHSQEYFGEVARISPTSAWLELFE